MNQNKKLKWLVILTAVLVLALVVAMKLGNQQSPAQLRDNPDMQPSLSSTQPDATDIQPDATENQPDATDIQPDTAETQPDGSGTDRSDGPTGQNSQTNTKPAGSSITIKPNSGSVVIKGEDGKQADAEMGVVKSEEAVPDAPDSAPGTGIQNGPSNTEDTPAPPTEPNKPQDSQNAGPDLTTTYQEYEAMTGDEQMRFYYSFADADAFIEWYNAAKAAYEANQEDIYIGEDGVVDIGGGRN